jgi:hypothetical protein
MNIIPQDMNILTRGKQGPDKNRTPFPDKEINMSFLLITTTANPMSLHY